MDALGHTEVVDAAVAPTCTETGLTEGKHCSVCSETLTAQETVDALGHTEVIDAAVAPTCTETGLTEGSHCGACSEVFVAQETVDALGHTPGAEATCTDPQNCTVCGAELASANGHAPGNEATCTTNQTCLVCEVELAPALGHTEVVDAAVAPTCTETGLTEGKRCSVCEDVLLAQETVAALGHTPGAAATCTTNQVCTVCNAELTAALGHNEVIDAAVAPTCTETGLTEGKHCSVCSEVLLAQETVAALGHTPGAAATCTTNQICTVCNTELTAALGHTPGAAATCTTNQSCTVCNAELVAALGHTEVVDAAVAPTCTETGLTEGKHCSVCSVVLLAQETVDALGHTPGTAATCTTNQICTVCNAQLVAALGHTPGAEATCTTNQSCTVCNAELVAALGHTPGAAATCTTNQVCTVCNAELTAALGHNEVIDAAVAPTCTETGLTEGKHCSVCSEVLLAQETVAALGHTPGAAATCTTNQICTVCNTELTAALGHTPGAAATCTTNQVCTVCNTELVAALGHTPGAEATCTTNQICTVCNAELVAALGHTPGDAATCTTNQICTVCNVELTAALGHTEVVDAAVAPTCTETGLTEGKHCAVCNEVIITQQNIPIASHQYSNQYVFNDDYHWKQCNNCDSTTPQREHVILDSVCLVCDPNVTPTEGIVYEISRNGTYAEVVGYTGSNSIIKIAEEYNGLPVKNICTNVFARTSASAVIIPDSVTSVRQNAFYASNIKIVVFGEGIELIEDCAFISCRSLHTLSLPNKPIDISDSAFSLCSLIITVYNNCEYVGSTTNPYHILRRHVDENVSSITVHSDTQIIADSAFYNCSRLASVVIPESVVFLSGGAFHRSGTPTVYYLGSQNQWKAIKKSICTCGRNPCSWFPRSIVYNYAPEE